MRVLLTGANGFVGSAVCTALSGAGLSVRGTVRNRDNALHLSKDSFNGEVISIGNIGPGTRWEEALQGIDTAIHLAARVHVMNDASSDPLSVHRYVNVEGTARLARSAAEAGVRRFIFLSTVKVNGESTQGAPFTESDEPRPQDAYALSKFEAEQSLHAVAQETGLEVVILRPPLVYGPYVRANFLRLMELVDNGLPLPFGSVQNARSLIFIDNLVNAIVTCVHHPAAANETYLVSDGEDLSTPELVSRLASALGKPTRLFPFPPSLLRLAGIVTGRASEIARLTDSLRVDSSKIRTELSWTPPCTVDEGVQRTAAWFRSHEKGL